MHNPAYLMLSRHSIYYFRWPLPQALRTPTAPRHIALSLGTRKPDEALRLSRVLEYHASRLIERYGAYLMNNDEMRDTVKRYLQTVLDKRKQAIRESGPLSPDEIQRFESLIADNDDRLDAAAEDMISDDSTMTEIMELAGVQLEKGSETYQRLRLNYHKARPAMLQEVIRFSQAQEHFDFTPRHTATPDYQPSRKQRQPLDKTAERFVAMQMEDKRWDRNTEQERLAHIEVLKEIIGPQFDMNLMNAEKARHVRDIIKRLPKNMNKNPKLRGLSLLECLEVKGVESLAPATISKYMETYNALFNWAVDEGYIEKNHFRTLRARIKPDKNKAKRTAFTPDQIKVMRNELLKGRGGLANRDYRYWGTLIAIYTGARLNEIAQIMLDDIKQEHGVWYFDMNDDGDNKKLKTDASRRYVPIHDALLDLGLIEYRDKLKRQGKKRFLHELTYCKKNGYGKKLGHFFNVVFLPKLDMKKPNVVFHCFRHTAITRLLQAEEALPVIQSIVGHERSGTAMKIYFEEGYKLPRLKEAINKLHPAIDTA